MMLLAIVLCAFSVGAIYAASPHCPWPWRRRLRRAGIGMGLAAALAALMVWNQYLGFGASLCVLVGCWALLALILPALATLAGKPS